MSGGSKGKSARADRPAASAGVPGEAENAAGLIGGLYRPDLSAPRSDAGLGHAAFGVLDRRGHATDLVAIAVERGSQPRISIIPALANNPLAGMLNPLAFGGYAGTGQTPAVYVICAAPPGPSLAAVLKRGASERLGDLEMIETVLRPAAHALDALAQRGFTHRAIRPDNIFSPGRGKAVTLGTAWSGPPGAFQPAIYEPPYLAQCHRYGRGEGVIADDVYALGVTLLVLALGDAPVRGFDDETILRRKLHHGSYSTLVEEARLPPTLSDLLRGMLAEDPEHRPPPLLLTDPSAARSRRVAARPPRRAQRPLEIGGIEAWNPRSLAHAMASFPEPGVQAIKNGSIDRWLRRMLGDAAMAHRFDLAVTVRNYDGAEGPYADMLRLTRATATLDPLSPFHWRGLACWPDALGSLLAAGFNQREVTSRIEEVAESEAVAVWAEARIERCDAQLLRPEARQLRVMVNTRGLAGQLPRALYSLNLALPCQSPLLDGMPVTRLPGLLVALEKTASRPELRKGLPADKHLMGFIAAHGEHRLDAQLAVFPDCPATELPVALLRLFATIQASTDSPRLVHLAAWLAGLCADRVELWHGRQNRERLAVELKEHAEAGALQAMLMLLEDRAGRADDQANAEQAASTVRQIDHELAQIGASNAARAARARTIAHEAIGAFALAGIVAAIIVLALT